MAKLQIFTANMELFDLTPEQLKRAASIKEQIDVLNKELRQLLDDSTANGAISKKKRTMNAAVKRKIVVAQLARWAKLRRSQA